MESKLTPYAAVTEIAANTVAVFAPHPDDEVFGCGGAIMRHVDHGTVVRVIIVSDGAYGLEGEARSEHILQRRQESLNSAAILGYGVPEFWELRDREVPYGEKLVRRIQDAIQEADLIYAPSVFEMHPDHRALGMAVIEAARRRGKGLRVALYEVGVPLRPNLLLDISRFAERKMAAMACFISQNKKQRYDLDIAALNRYRTYTLPAEVTAAEAYILVSAEELTNDPFKIYQSEHKRQRELGLTLEAKDVPLISVIVRSMDRPTLSKALDSVALQTYSNIEVVVVNAKGEKHSQLGEWCGHFPLRIINTGEALQRSRAGNVGLSNAQGDFLIFLDDDDTFDANHISGLVQALREHPQATVIYTGVRAEDDDGHLLSVFNEHYDPRKLLISNFIPIHALLFSRDLMKKSGAHFDESMDVYEDWDFWLQLSRHTTFLHVNQVSAVYHTQGDSGVGLATNKNTQQQGREQLFDKWRLRWTGKDIDDIAQYIVDFEQRLAERDSLIAKLNRILTERSEHIDNINRAFTDHINNLNQVLAERNKHIGNLNQALTERSELIQEIYQSTSWRITAPLRKLSLKAKNLGNLIKLLPSIFRISGGITKSVKKASRVFLREGWAGVKRRILFVGGDRNGTSDSKIRPDIALPEVDRNDYTEWLCRYDTLKDADRVKIQSNIADFQAKPLISVVMPVYNPPISFLDEAIQSVRRQLYPNWELCIADDASTDPAVRETLARHCREDHRIKVVYRDQNGHISRASNSALELAQGEFVALFDHDDLLAEHALYWVAEAINRHPDAGLIFSDEDKINESNRRYDPYFKCELNYELLLAQNMVSHLGVYRTEVVRDLGGFRVGFEGSQDYDLVLRVLEKLKPEQIVHIPRILYHWRAIAGSTALAAGEKNYAVEAGRKAVADHLKRNGINAEVMPAPEVPTLNRVRFSCPSPQPLVSLIIPTRDRTDLLGMCLDSLIQRTTYENYEVIIVDNGSVEAATQQLFERLPKERFSILRDESPFNFSALNNKAAQLARGELLCLMNNDIEILTPDWLEEMVSFAVRPDIGCVGARLWYPDGSLQHGGILLGIGGVGNHAHYKVGRHNPGYFGRAFLHQSFSAVTAACLLVRRDVFDVVGGLDEQLAVAFNDVDFCLRVRDAGYRNVWTPYAEMNHHESASRGVEDTPEKQIRFFNEVSFVQSRWDAKLFNDPAYSPNLTLDYADFSFAWPPRIEG